MSATNPPDLCDNQRATSLLFFRRGITQSNPKGPGAKEEVEEGHPRDEVGARDSISLVGTVLGESLSLGALLPVTSWASWPQPPGSRRRQGHPKTLVRETKAWPGCARGLGFAGGLWVRRGTLFCRNWSFLCASLAQPENKKPPRREKREPPPREN